MLPDERQKHRMAEMKPVMDDYWDFLSSFSSEKDSNLQKAQTYSLHQRKQLEAVLLDGRLELTNNVAERSVKPIVMAGRNFLFCDTAKGADASALCFSVIETAKRNKLDPFGYLLFLLQELPKPGSEQLMSNSCRYCLGLRRSLNIAICLDFLSISVSRCSYFFAFTGDY